MAITQRIKSSILCLLSLLWINLGIASESTLKVGLYQNAPKIFSEQSQPSGFFVDLSNEIARKKNLNIEYKECIWSDCLLMLENGEIDVMPDVAYSQSRAALFQFGESAVLDSWAAVYAKQNIKIQSEFDLQNKTIAVLKNSFQADYLKETLPKYNISVRFVDVDSFREGFQLVSEGIVDCVVANRFFGALQKVDDDIYMTPMVFNYAEIRYAFAPNISQKLIKDFDQAIVDLKKQSDSVYFQAYKKWLTPEYKVKTNRTIKYALIFSVIAALLFMIISMVFKRLLTQKTQELINQNKQYDYLAHHDPLTALPNRLMFFENIENAIINADKKNQKFALLYIDLDQFKQINDTLGHSVGDDLLQLLSLRLINVMQNASNISRLGGDEFAVVINPMLSDDLIIELINQIQSAIKKPLIVNGQTFHLSSSIGVSIYPQDGTNSSDIIRNADTAMFKAKEQRRDSYLFYSTSMTQNMIQQSEMLKDLRAAIIRNEFYMVYQPQYNIETNELVGIESLVRWEHPQKGMISPLHFISVAENSGLIIELGKQIMLMVCSQVVDWSSQGFDSIKVSINISGKQLQADGFVESVTSILELTGCQPQCIEFEVTESFFIQNIDLSTKVLKQIRDMGIEVAIDDFGTGYSSLAYLKWIPANRLKIDQSFVRDLGIDENDKAIIAAIIAFAKATNLTVIAEGIETEYQREILLSLECKQGQGYLLSKPVSPESFFNNI